MYVNIFNSFIPGCFEVLKDRGGGRGYNSPGEVLGGSGQFRSGMINFSIYPQKLEVCCGPCKKTRLLV